MAHEIAKLLLEHAGTAIERSKAIETAVRLGMPLHEIDQYLEWLSLLRREPIDGPERTDGGHRAADTEETAE